MQLLKFAGFIKQALLHLALPYVCELCGTDILHPPDKLCLSCSTHLPGTGFEKLKDNPMERLFWGRLPISMASASYYFTKGSAIQQLLHQFKYRNNRELGFFLGRLMGIELKQAGRFEHINALVPLPLYHQREFERGFNQARILCEGIQSVWEIPILDNVVIRKSKTESQTRKSRIERWQNMEDQFDLIDARKIEGRHLLLVDDVVTTGATLEACGRALLTSGKAKLSMATLCISSGN